MVVALLALVVALGGSAVAATKLVSGDKLIKPRTLHGNRLADDSVSGRQVNEKKLGPVPHAVSASNATHAVSADSANSSNTANSANTAATASTAASAATAHSLDGESVERVFYKASIGSPPRTILTLAGLTLTATCPNANGPRVQFSTAVDNTDVEFTLTDVFSGHQTSGSISSFGVAAGPADLLAPSSTSDHYGDGVFTYGRPDGRTVSLSFGWDDTPTLGGADCAIFGTASGG